MRLLPVLAALAAGPAFGQQPGLLPEWETRKLLTSLVDNAKKIEPLIAEIRPSDWISQGAPDAYQLQWQRVSQSIGGLQAASQKLAARPSKLTHALATLYGLESMQGYLGSLAAGVRKYQNPALADLVMGVSDENANNRETLKQYILELAVASEAEFNVMDNEAQRCRDMLVRQPPARPAAKPKPTPAKKDRP